MHAHSDFAGPYTIGRGSMAFGEPTRFVRLNPEQCRNLDWDAAIERANRVYSQRMHNICCDNCHSHVAVALEFMEWRGLKHFNMVQLAFWLFFLGRYRGVCAILKTWLPFVLVLGVVLLVYKG